MPSFWEQFKKPVVSAGRTLGEWLKKGVRWKPPGYVSPTERPEIAKPIKIMPREAAPPITTTLGKLFRGEEIQMIRPGSALERVAKAQAAAREEITEKIGKPIAEKLVTAPREFAIPAAKGFLGEPIYKRILEPVVPEAMRDPKGRIVPAAGKIAGWMTAFGKVAGALGKLMTTSKIGQTLISHAPRISRAVQIAGAGLTLDQAHAPLESTFEERKKIFTTGLPRWAGWGVAGMIAPAKVYAWLPTIFGTQYASAKLEGQSNEDAFKDALTMTAIFSLFKIADLPKSPQQMLREQAFKKLNLKPKATADEIKKAYRVLAHKYHPDRPGGDLSKFKVIADAYKILDTTPRQFQKDIFTEIRDFYKYLRSPEGKKMALMIVEEMPVGFRIKAVKPKVKPVTKELESLVIYRGSDVKLDMGKIKGAVFFSTNKEVAERYAEISSKGEGGIIEEFQIDKNANILKDVPPELKKYADPDAVLPNNIDSILYNYGKKHGHDVIDLRKFGQLAEEKEVIVINPKFLKATKPVEEVKPAVTMAEVFKPKPEPVALTAKEDAELKRIYNKELSEFKVEGEKQLFRDVKDLGGLKTPKGLEEEMSEVPIDIRRVDGFTPDEIISELNEMGYNFKSGDDLIEMIKSIRTMPTKYQAGKTTLEKNIEFVGAISSKMPKVIKPKVSARLLRKLYRIKYPKVPATLKAARRAVEKGVIKEIPAELIVRKGKGFVMVGETVEAAPEPPAPATTKQVKLAHVLAKSKAMIGAKGKMKPQYRALAKAITGETSMKSMTEKEASEFIDALKKLPEPYYVKGRLIPPSISKVTALVPKGFFEGMKFKEPTIVRYLTPQTYYSQILGVKPLVEPLELAKQRFDLVYRDMANGVDKMIKAIDEIGGTTAKEKIKAKIKNIPTEAVKETRNLLNEYEEAPADLLPAKKEIFNWFRNLTQETWRAENKMRAKLDLPLIEYRRAYVKHTADALAQEMLQGRYPFPEGLKFWSQKIVGKKIFNPMELRRKLAEDLEKLWTEDLALATKSMLWTALKEIHLSQPLKFFNEQLGAVSKDSLIYKNLTPEEQDIYSQIRTMPASTKKWLVDYVNQVIKGQETWLDTHVNNVVTKTGLKGLLNKVLAPFGRSVGRKPITKVFQTAGRIMIHGVMGPLRPKQIIRNKFQLTQNLALYTLKANLKGFYPVSVDKNLEKLMRESLFLQTYTGMEELPIDIMGRLEKANLAGFQWSAKSNVAQGMKVSYWDTLELITDPKYKDFGWADPERIKLNYDVPEGKLYPSEKEKLIKEMEFGASATQYHYIAMGMPEVFRHKALVPVTRLQSWWMNYFFKFNREAIMRGIKGETGYGAKLPWSRRLGWFRYLIIGGIILNTLGYERSYLWGAAPTGVPPTAQFVTGLYTYLTTLPNLDEDWAKRKNAQAKNQMYYSIKTFIPGYLAWKDFMGLWSGEKSFEEYFFYKKKKKEKKPIEVKPIGGKTMGGIFKPTKRILESPTLR